MLFRDFVQSRSTIPLPSLDTYFDRVTPLPAETNISERDRVTENELFHYISVLYGRELKNRANYEESKEPQVRSLLMEFLAVRSIPNVKCALSVNGVSRHHVYVTYSDVTVVWDYLFTL